MDDTSASNITLCPSARPELADSVVFGILNGTVEEPRVTYLKQPQLVTDELIAQASPVTPTEIFRIAAPCATSACQHFDGKNCRIAQRTVEHLLTVVEELPACSIRASCRWWQQEGKAACMRCPQIITDDYNPSQLMREVAKLTAE